MRKLSALMGVVVVCSSGLIYGADTLINITGTVKDVAGVPVPGAKIYVNAYSTVAYSGADGKYSLLSVPVRYFQQKTVKAPPLISKNALSFQLTQPQAVRLEILDLSGKCVDRIVNDRLTANKYSYTLPVGKLATSAYVVSLKIGDDNFIQRILVQENGILQSGRQPAAAATPNDNRMAKMLSEAINDSVFCEKDCYFDTVPILSYTGNIDLTLPKIDTIPPTLKLLGGDTVRYSFQSGAYNKNWFSPDMYEVHDNVDPDSLLNNWQNVNPSITDYNVQGIYSMEYVIFDNSPCQTNSTRKTRILIIYDSLNVDAVPPVITLMPADTPLTTGSTFDLKFGLTIKDSIDTMVVFDTWVSITDNIQTTMPREYTNVTFDVPGIYTVTYKVIDTYLNPATKTRTITVANDQ